MPSPLCSSRRCLLLLSFFILVLALALNIQPLRSTASSLLLAAKRSSTASAYFRSGVLASHLFTFNTGNFRSSPLPPQPIASMSTSEQSALRTATFACGCFWSVELVFQREPGVADTAVGYTGGSVPSPSYEAVCTGKTGHYEAVQVKFDPARVTYGRLLDVFFDKHDSTQVDGQGNDRGSQYRSAVFYHDEQQRVEAEKRKEEEHRKLGKPIATQLLPAVEFYRAEEYHQRYLEKGGQCSIKGDKTKIRCYG